MPATTVGRSAPWAHFACFSLQDSKHVTCGDGGVVGSNDERFGPLLQKFGDKGGNRIKWGGFDAFATNYRMSEPQAAVAAAQLARLEAIAASRRDSATCSPRRSPTCRASSPTRCTRKTGPFTGSTCSASSPEAFRCGRSEFVHALSAEGASVTGGYIKVPLYGEPVFQNHGFFAGHWPVKEMGLTSMDFSKHKCPEAEAILATGIRVPIYESMTEEYILGVAAAIRKVARHYAA